MPDQSNTVKKEYKKLFGFTFGQISFGSFLIALLSGVILAIPYDITKPFDSISLMLLSNPAGVLFRNIHYWSSQIFLLFTLLHLYDHFFLSTEKNVKKGVWLRLTISIFFTFFILLSGFILKGDIEGLQAKRIFTSLFDSIPIIGKNLGFVLLGSERDHQILYMNHIATAAIFLLIVIIEHAKTYWPRISVVLYLLIPSVIIGYIFPPSLFIGNESVIKGPWYFVGLQEILHWIDYPVIVVLVVTLLFFLVYYLQRFDEKFSGITKKFLLILFFFYSGFSIIGYFFRGENWQFVLPWDNPYFVKTSINPVTNIESVFAADSLQSEIPVVLGHREGCLTCHNNIKGFSHAHNPDAIGCYSCHSGNPFSLNKKAAHQGMILIPGNFSDAKQSCGNSQCHPQITERINTTLMTTLSGIIAVDKFVFGESKSLDEFYKVDNLGHSPAETHLRNLCVSCHVGGVKSEYGPINELSRGGGCNACHLIYSDSAIQELKKFGEAKQNLNSKKEFNFTEHPSLALTKDDNHCFGCHSRSGRISTNYEGWHETQLTPEDVSGKSGFRILQDERVFRRTQSDVHFEKGMLCVDCHDSYEVMGDGKYYVHKENQTKIQCIDCHFTGKPVTKKLSEFDNESLKIAELRKTNYSAREYLTVNATGIPMVNTYYSENGTYLIKKKTGEQAVMKPPVFDCVGTKAHKDLSCNSCHSSWAPQCVTCHTEFDKNGTAIDLLTEKEVKGEWIERGKNYLAEPPTLGVRIIEDENGKSKRVINTFIAGMILTIDKDKKSQNGGVIFKRLFAPTFSHTIVKESRGCKSCHNDPLAIGYGRGKLTYKIKGNKSEWNFVPEFPSINYDGLPEDAWIGFLKDRKGEAATRTNARPFTVDEQKRILLVGTCLTCHDEKSSLMRKSLIDFEGLLNKRTSKCILPNWY